MSDISEVKYALDTFYVLISGALVLWMAAGFAMLESGLVRSKNTVEILCKNVGLFCIACLMYYLCGYAIMYPGAQAASPYFPGLHAFVGETDHSAAQLAAGEVSYAHLADFFFQIVFVATAMSVVSGAVAERMKLWAFFAFAVVMCGLLYPIQGYWKWGGGFLNQKGFVDFAGSGVVHLAGASAALAGVLLLGARSGKYGKGGQIYAIPGANLPLATLGTMILWLGWLGFNGGSQLAVSSLDNANAVARVFANTTLAAAAGGLTAMVAAQMILKKLDLTMLLNGILGGLVAITAAPDTPALWLALLVGGVGGVLVVLAVLGFDRLKIDDPVGAISVHGVCGIWGLMAVPFSQAEASFAVQGLGVLTIFAFIFTASLGIWFVLKATLGIRVDAQVEYDGIDRHECGMHAYPEFVQG